MKVYIANDTSNFHAGTSAAMKYLKQNLMSGGHEIICTTERPLGPDYEAIKKCDAIIVNGEGAMGCEETSWHCGRATSLLKGLEEAKRLGKKAYLINSVWYKMKPVWTDLLKSLDGIWVREISSQSEMEKGQGVKPEMCLDLSYFSELEQSNGADEFLNKDVVGVFYSRNMPRFGAFDYSHKMFKGMKYLGLSGHAEGNGKLIISWTYIVNSLKMANLYVTGQHHGIYAACCARIPFAMFKVNTHKIEGLFKWAGVDIPIAKTRRQLEKVIKWARTHREIFERLFDWMEKQPEWPGI